MTLDTITIPLEEAEKAAREYAAAVRADRAGARSAWRKEDAELARTFRALAKGKRLIDLPKAIAAGGQFETGLPKLAVLRSDAVSCYCEIGWQGTAMFSDLPSNTWRMKKEHHETFEKLFPARNARIHGRCLVPMIPPALRPKDNIARYRTLWEVDTWELLPPRDPALLRHVAGNIYAVLAVWDLTDLERMVLGVRAASLR